MKQLGNLALVCVQRKHVRLEMQAGEVSVHIHAAPGETYHLRWDDDQKIEEISRELNFGKYREVK